ncbi:DUF5077 domain-containing protein [Dysgonomonas sp. PF1-23]
MDGNTYITGRQQSRNFINPARVTDWTNPQTKFSSWFIVTETGLAYS